MNLGADRDTSQELVRSLGFAGVGRAGGTIVRSYERLDKLVSETTSEGSAAAHETGKSTFPRWPESRAGVAAAAG